MWNLFGVWGHQSRNSTAILQLVKLIIRVFFFQENQHGNSYMKDGEFDEVCMRNTKTFMGKPEGKWPFGGGDDDIKWILGKYNVTSSDLG